MHSLINIFLEGKRAFHRCGADGEWHRPDKVNQVCLPKCKWVIMFMVPFDVKR